MDAPGFDSDVMAAALNRIGGFTRSFGGVRAVRRQLRDHPGATVLDVGAGDLSLLDSIAATDGARGALWVGVDSHADVVSVAGRTADRGGRTHALQADGRALPFRDDSFDVVVSTLTLHHLDDEGAVDLLAEMGRVARLRVFVWDLERSVVALGGAWALASTVWRSDPVVRNDAPLSVRRAFTAVELTRIAERAGLRRTRVRRAWPARLVLEADPSGGVAKEQRA